MGEEILDSVDVLKVYTRNTISSVVDKLFVDFLIITNVLAD